MSRLSVIEKIYDLVHEAGSIQEAHTLCKSLYISNDYKNHVNADLIELVYTVITSNKEATKEDVVGVCMYGGIEMDVITSSSVNSSTLQNRLHVSRNVLDLYKEIHGVLTVAARGAWIIVLEGNFIDVDVVRRLVPDNKYDEVIISQGRTKRPKRPPAISPKASTTNTKEDPNIVRCNIISWDLKKFMRMHKEQEYMFILNGLFTEFRAFATSLYFYNSGYNTPLECDIIYRHHTGGDLVMSGNIGDVSFSHVYHNGKTVPAVDLKSLMLNDAIKNKQYSLFNDSNKYIDTYNIFQNIRILQKLGGDKDSIRGLFEMLNKKVSSKGFYPGVHSTFNTKDQSYLQIVYKTILKEKSQTPCVHIQEFNKITPYEYDEQIGNYLRKYMKETSGHYSCIHCGVFVPMFSNMLIDLISVNGKALFFKRFEAAKDIFTYAPYNNYYIAKSFVMNFIHYIDKQFGTSTIGYIYSISKEFMDTLLYIKNNRLLLIEEHKIHISTLGMFLFSVVNESFLLESNIKEFQLENKRNNMYAILLIVFCLHMNKINAELICKDTTITFDKMFEIIIKRMKRSKMIVIDDTAKYIKLLYVYAGLRDNYLLSQLKAKSIDLNEVIVESSQLSMNDSCPSIKFFKYKPLYFDRYMPLSTLQSKPAKLFNFKVEDEKIEAELYNSDLKVSSLISEIQESKSIIVSHNKIEYIGYKLIQNTLYLHSAKKILSFNLDTLEDEYLPFDYKVSAIYALLHIGEKIPLRMFLDPPLLQKKENGVIYLIDRLGGKQIDFKFPSQSMNRAQLDSFMVNIYKLAFGMDDLKTWSITNKTRILFFYKEYIKQYEE